MSRSSLPSGSDAAPVPEVGPVEARALVRIGALLLDVREVDEWQAGHAAKAQHLPLGDLPASLDALPRGRTIVVVCRSGNRSAQATALLRSAGFDALNLAGGMGAWAEAGFPLVDRGGAAGRVA